MKSYLNDQAELHFNYPVLIKYAWDKHAKGRTNTLNWFISFINVKSLFSQKISHGENFKISTQLIQALLFNCSRLCFHLKTTWAQRGVGRGGDRERFGTHPYLPARVGKIPHPPSLFSLPLLSFCHSLFSSSMFSDWLLSDGSNYYTKLWIATLLHCTILLCSFNAIKNSALCGHELHCSWGLSNKTSCNSCPASSEIKLNLFWG